MRRFCLPVFLGCIAVLLFSSVPRALAQNGAVPFDTERWSFDAERGAVVTHLGRRSLRLQNTSATLKGVTMQDGTIEVDVSMPSVRGFAYIQFRKQDEANGEIFYVRMHKSGNPDALQYAPRDNGVTAWQLYHGEGYTAPATFSKDAWTHVRLEVAGSQARVFIGDAADPVMVVPELKRGDRTGGVGLLGTIAEEVYFSNFRFTPAPSPAPWGEPGAAAPGVITRWSLSKSLTEADLPNPEASPQLSREAAGWRTVESEPSGLVNVSRYQQATGRPSRVLARTTIRSASAQTTKLYFGYSDDVVVFLNGTPLYGGISGFQSRNPTYQGFISADDVVFLNLNAGANELLFVVSETFGGWGFMARLESMSGITIE